MAHVEKHVSISFLNREFHRFPKIFFLHLKSLPESALKSSWHLFLKAEYFVFKIKYRSIFKYQLYRMLQTHSANVYPRCAKYLFIYLFILHFFVCVFICMLRILPLCRYMMRTNLTLLSLHSTYDVNNLSTIL